MRGATGCATWLYAQLLRLYPASFRAGFEDEMRAVFAAALADATTRGRFSLAAVCWRELRDLPESLLRAYWLRLRQRVRSLAPASQLGGGMMEDRNADRRLPWSEIWIGLIPFGLFGLEVLTNYLPGHWPAVSLARVILRGSIYLALLIAFGVGWIAGFPRWFYLYPVLMLAATAFGVLFFGTQYGYWLGLLFSVPLALTVAVAGRRTRSLRGPFERVWQDWTLLSFAFYGLMPLAQSLAFDDGHANDETLFLALSAGAIVAGAALYLRSRNVLQRVSALLGGMTAVLLMAVLDKAHFAGGLGPWLDQFTMWGGELAWLANLWRLLAVLIFWPALLGLLRHTLHAARTA